MHKYIKLTKRKLAFCTLVVLLFLLVSSNLTYGYWQGTINAVAYLETARLGVGMWERNNGGDFEWPAIEGPVDNPESIPEGTVFYLNEGEPPIKNYYMIREEIPEGVTLPTNPLDLVLSGGGNRKILYVNTVGDGSGPILYYPNNSYKRYDIVWHEGSYHWAKNIVYRAPGNSDNPRNSPSNSPNLWERVLVYNPNTSYVRGQAFLNNSINELYRVINNAPAGTAINNTNYFALIDESIEYLWND